MMDIINCQKFSAEDNEEDPRNITIPESEGQCVVVVPTIESLDVTKPLNIWQVNIGSEEQKKLAKIGDY